MEGGSSGLKSNNSSKNENLGITSSSLQDGDPNTMPELPKSSIVPKTLLLLLNEIQATSVHTETEIEGISECNNLAAGSDDKASLTDLNQDNNRMPEELQTDLEDQLCALWDLTVGSEDTCKSLLGHDGGRLLCMTIAATNKPRLAEICLGISANLLCFPSMSRGFAVDNDLIDAVLPVMHSRDTQVLIECCRVLQAVVIMDNPSVWPEHWAIKFRTEKCLDDMMFILTSSTNIKLLEGCLKFLESLLDSDKIPYLSNELVSSVLVACKECNKGKSMDALCIGLRVLHLIAIDPHGTKLICTSESSEERHFTKMAQFLLDTVLLKWVSMSDWDIAELGQTDLMSLACACGILDACVGYEPNLTKVLCHIKLFDTLEEIRKIVDIESFPSIDPYPSLIRDSVSNLLKLRSDT